MDRGFSKNVVKILFFFSIFNFIYLFIYLIYLVIYLFIYLFIFLDSYFHRFGEGPLNPQESIHEKTYLVTIHLQK